MSDVSKIVRLQQAVRMLTRWSGSDMADLVEEGYLMDGDLEAGMNGTGAVQTSGGRGVVDAVARAIFMTDYGHAGEGAWEAARLDGNSDRADAFVKARAALLVAGRIDGGQAKVANKYAGFLARQNHQRERGWRGIGTKCLCGKLFDLDANHAMHQVEAILEAASGRVTIESSEEQVERAAAAVDALGWDSWDGGDDPSTDEIVRAALGSALEAQTGAKVDMSSAVGVEAQLAAGRSPTQGEPIDDQVEQAAIACMTAGDRGWRPVDWEGLHEDARNIWRRYARAALASVGVAPIQYTDRDVALAYAARLADENKDLLGRLAGEGPQVPREEQLYRRVKTQDQYSDGSYGRGYEVHYELVADSVQPSITMDEAALAGVINAALDKWEGDEPSEVFVARAVAEWLNGLAVVEAIGGE